VAKKIESLYLTENKEWECQDQVRDQKYGDGEYGLFKTESPFLPGADEVYTAKFWWAKEMGAETKNIFDQYFKPALKQISQSELTEYDVRAYKLENGGHFRVHFDYWTCDIGCIYYINKKWIWDWGGILHVGLEEGVDSVIPIFPKFNRAIFIDHGGLRVPHFISPVTEYAQNPRLSLTSLCK
jgi:hypothetical protein